MKDLFIYFSKVFVIYHISIIFVGCKEAEPQGPVESRWEDNLVFKFTMLLKIIIVHDNIVDG